MGFVGDDFNTHGLELTHGVFLLGAAFEHANFFAFDGGGAGVLHVFLQDHAAGRVVVLVGEVNGFEAVGGDGHGADDHVVFFGLQAGDHAVPHLLYEYAFAFDLLAQGVGNVHVKAGGLAVRGFEGEGLVGGVNGHLEVFALGKRQGAQ